MFQFVVHPFDSLFPGDSSHVVVKQVASELYSQHEINSAIEVVKKDFSAFNGCTLTFITYKGDNYSSYETEHKPILSFVNLILCFLCNLRIRKYVILFAPT